MKTSRILLENRKTMKTWQLSGDETKDLRWRLENDLRRWKTNKYTVDVIAPQRSVSGLRADFRFTSVLTISCVKSRKTITLCYKSARTDATTVDHITRTRELVLVSLPLPPREASAHGVYAHPAYLARTPAVGAHRSSPALERSRLPRGEEARFYNVYFRRNGGMEISHAAHVYTLCLRIDVIICPRIWHNTCGGPAAAAPTNRRRTYRCTRTDTQCRLARGGFPFSKSIPHRALLLAVFIVARMEISRKYFHKASHRNWNNNNWNRYLYTCI